MFYFAEITDSCISILGVLFFIREIIKIVIFIIPIALIVMLSIDFTKGVISFDFKDDKTIKYVTKRVIYTVVLLLIPITIFSAFKVLGVIVTDSESCWAYVGENSVADIKAKVAAKHEKVKKETQDLIKEVAKKSSLTVKDKKTVRTIVETSTSDEANDNSTTNSGNITLDWNDLSKTSNIGSSANLTKALNQTKNLKKWALYAVDLYNSEQENNVNVFFLIGLEAHESGLMKSAISKDCNNLGGVRNKPYCSGHGTYRKFNNKKDFIKYHAKLLGNSYIKKGRKSLSKIKGTYCGSGSDCSDWIPGTKKFGNQVYNQAKKNN